MPHFTWLCAHATQLWHTEEVILIDVIHSILGAPRLVEGADAPERVAHKQYPDSNHSYVCWTVSSDENSESAEKPHLPSSSWNWYVIEQSLQAACLVGRWPRENWTARFSSCPRKAGQDLCSACSQCPLWEVVPRSHVSNSAHADIC